MATCSSPSQAATEGADSEIMPTAVSRRSITASAESSDQSGVPQRGFPIFSSTAWLQNGGIMWK